MFFHAHLAATCATSSDGASGQVVTLPGLLRDIRQVLRARRAVAAFGEDEGVERAKSLVTPCA